jgi:hypothetical protein
MPPARRAAAPTARRRAPPPAPDPGALEYALTTPVTDCTMPRSMPSPQRPSDERRLEGAAELLEVAREVVHPDRCRERRIPGIIDRRSPLRDAFRAGLEQDPRRRDLLVPEDHTERRVPRRAVHRRVRLRQLPAMFASPRNFPCESYSVIPSRWISFDAAADGDVSEDSMPRSPVPACSPMMPFCANSASVPTVSSRRRPSNAPPDRRTSDPARGHRRSPAPCSHPPRGDPRRATPGRRRGGTASGSQLRSLPRPRRPARPPPRGSAHP